MAGSDGHEVFSLLWSVTDKIFEHVADIRNLLNTAGIPVASNLSDDPPSYESCTSEHFIEQLKEKFNCLEDLNKQRKLLYDQHADKENECDQVRNVRSEKDQQVSD
ncbi:unnamed protein product [Calicophoron daubneyi]|uniref:Uncharacterized protein n=1 Tax=Calicophoron daubneyi TaxID=300641 RepID=A0AAV2TLH3_CALDB